MISKICTGHSFRGSILYICQESKHAEILFSEGVRDYNPKLMIQDFEMQQGFRPEKNQVCFHGILSFYPGEDPGSDKIQEIARKYLEGLNIRNTQLAIIKHADNAHLHVHLIANMVDNSGKSISDRWIGLRGKKLSQQLTQEYKLIQTVSKDLSKIHIQKMNEPERHKYLIYAAIKNQLRESRSMDELEIRLQKHGITMLYKYNGKTDEKQGVSFKLGEYAFKGSEIDRMFSYLKLEKVFSLQQHHTLEEHPHGSSDTQMQNQFQYHRYRKNILGMTNTISNSIKETLELLFKQEQEYDRMPYELSQGSERKKRQRHRQQHL